MIFRILTAAFCFFLLTFTAPAIAANPVPSQAAHSASALSKPPANSGNPSATPPSPGLDPNRLKSVSGQVNAKVSPKSGPSLKLPFEIKLKSGDVHIRAKKWLG